jgi:hypothetical protein
VAVIKSKEEAFAGFGPMHGEKIHKSKKKRAVLEPTPEE